MSTYRVDKVLEILPGSGDEYLVEDGTSDFEPDETRSSEGGEGFVVALIRDGSENLVG